VEIDGQLVKRFADGDPSAFRSIFRTAVSDVYWLAYRMIGHKEAAEDVVQETFIRVYRMRRKIDPRRSLPSLIMRIATNLAIDFLRKDQRDNRMVHADSPEAALETTPASAGFSEEAQTNRIALEQALDGLPAIYRSVLVLKYAHDFSYHEIAETLGISVPAVALRIKRGKELLRQKLSETND
jgi:RNA polymerase sigma-70 factor (ECF subfamily)